jgi:hypothetical protein
MLITNTFRHDILARFWHDSSMSVRDLILLINPVNGPIGLWLAMNLELCCEQQINILQHRMIENICNYSFLDSQFMEDT